MFHLLNKADEKHDDNWDENVRHEKYNPASVVGGNVRNFKKNPTSN